MMRAIGCLLLCIVALLFTPVCGAQQKDAKGCQDSALLSRFPGSVITSCSHKEDDSYTFRLAKGIDKTVEGDLRKIDYDFPKSASPAQVQRNLVTALRSAGYGFERDPSDNSRGNFVVHMGKTWIGVEFYGNGSGMTEIILVETQLQQEVVATAAALSTGLASNGHIVVNGIHFDTGKSEIKPDSAPALQEIAKLLQQDAKLKIYVVGHTDNVGTLAANVDLSRRRAAAVVQVLVTQYHVATDRLQAFGAGPYAPVASNDSEDGRALNRRVELVKQ
jgi:outer membrane protein OmpA-like peptidoglycan-associated protein